MLSILIPTYNHNALPLAEALVKQLSQTNLIYELICSDDGSTSPLNIENQKINSLANSRFIAQKKNVGRNANRQFLAEQASYEWLLFVDADTLPKHANFIAQYQTYFSDKFEAIFGGFAYQKIQTKNRSLRYRFGKSREEVPAVIRNKTPYKVIISANFLIKRAVFITLNKKVTTNIYGLDYLFGASLKKHNIQVFHIDNEVYHLGIDTNSEYLEKTKKAITALTFIKNASTEACHDISLLKAYTTLERLRLTRLFLFCARFLKPLLLKNLMSSTPNLFAFDLYRLSHFCELNTQAQP